MQILLTKHHPVRFLYRQLLIAMWYNSYEAHSDFTCSFMSVACFVLICIARISVKLKL